MENVSKKLFADDQQYKFPAAYSSSQRVSSSLIPPSGGSVYSYNHELLLQEQSTASYIGPSNPLTAGGPTQQQLDTVSALTTSRSGGAGSPFPDQHFYETKEAYDDEDQDEDNDLYEQEDAHRLKEIYLSNDLLPEQSRPSSAAVVFKSPEEEEWYRARHRNKIRKNRVQDYLLGRGIASNGGHAIAFTEGINNNSHGSPLRYLRAFGNHSPAGGGKKPANKSKSKGHMSPPSYQFRKYHGRMRRLREQQQNPNHSAPPEDSPLDDPARRHEGPGHSSRQELKDTQKRKQQSLELLFTNQNLPTMLTAFPNSFKDNLEHAFTASLLQQQKDKPVGLRLGFTDGNEEKFVYEEEDEGNLPLHPYQQKVFHQLQQEGVLQGPGSSLYAHPPDVLASVVQPSSVPQHQHYRQQIDSHRKKQQQQEPSMPIVARNHNPSPDEPLGLGSLLELPSIYSHNSAGLEEDEEVAAITTKPQAVNARRPPKGRPVQFQVEDDVFGEI
jgi:hypothetical protein